MWEGAAMPEVELSAGTIEYEDTGSGPPVVLLHGLAMDGSLWRNVVADLRADHRCIVPTLPLGSHRRPMHPDADLSFRGHVRLIAELLERLDLRDVTLVQSDLGFAQLLAAEHPERLARLVLLSCEAFDNYPPGLPGRILGLAAKLPGGLNALVQPLRFRPLRRSPMALGRMAKRPIPHEITDAWLRPLFTQRQIRRDLLKYLRPAMADRKLMLTASEGVAAFDRPALVIWAAEDRVMPPEHGRRLAELLPQGRLVEIADSYTLIPEDQPGELATTIRRFVEDNDRSEDKWTQMRAPATNRS
jgi:pimeloyl-ACP methyl ester carboxylesterase